ncbi:MAG: transporter [Candidatus Krumholzibacteria bacterium]|nr:transporter [Candidatus Krumholzibacteria bacterium]MDH4336871.1 transporter [Candidatus Krumholzibacteria bacterium]MDH5269202.1 transporter [Candidatus Krumholzibacteria bacterium]MDH5626952.1 transporter [Candidatus Krumholzibacteria bacterium]
MRATGFTLAVVCAATAWLAAAAPAARAIRPMATDRPTRTDTPYSVPAEHFQLEMDFVTVGHLGYGDTDIDGFSIAPFNLKYGFTDAVDVQFLITPYLSTTTTTGGSEETEDGFGPAGMRIKVNLTGNDGEGTAVAVIPYFVAPTRGIEKLDNTVYGLSVPFAFTLANGRTLGAAAGAEAIGDGDTSVFASVVFSTPVVDAWSGYLELYGIAGGLDDADTQIVTLDAGAVLDPGRNWAFDAGINVGITPDTEDWRVFVGASARR